MGFFSDLTGSSAKKALWTQAEKNLTASKQYGNSYANSHNQLSEAQTQGQQAILDSFDNAYNTNEQGYNEALNYYAPFIDQGEDASRVYRDALGLNGDGSQNEFYDNEQNSAGFQSGLNAGIGALMAKYAATNTARIGEDGLPRSGRVLKGLQEHGNRYLGDYIGNKLSHLNSLQGQGYNAAQGAANLTSNYYGNQGNLNLAQGQAENQYHTIPAETISQGQLGKAQALYQGQTNYNNGIAQGQITKSNATNNLVTQGLNLASAFAPKAGGFSGLFKF